MDAVKYLRERRRMCEETKDGCYGCLIYALRKEEELSCVGWQEIFPEKAVEIVEKWSTENPQKTMLQDFLEKYPNVQLNGYGCPSFCPSLLGYDRNKSCLPDEMRCPACWNRPLEG